MGYYLQTPNLANGVWAEFGGEEGVEFVHDSLAEPQQLHVAASQTTPARTC